MIARISTDLPSSAEKVWRALLRRDTFLYITRGALGYRGADQWPRVFEEGTEIDIAAGWLTPAVWAYAHLFYRYRQRRWRRLASTL